MEKKEQDFNPEQTPVVFKNTVESTLEPEQEKNYKYLKVAFGHNFRDFDRDQMVTYFLALQSKLLSPQAGAIFSSRLETKTLSDPQTLSIEAVTDDSPLNKTELGQYNNTLDGDPAAANFFQTNQRQYGKDLPYKEQLKELVAWIKIVDNPQSKKQLNLNLLNKSDLDQLTLTMEGLKLLVLNNELDLKDFLPQINEICLDLIQQKNQGDWQEKYKTLTELAKIKKEKDRQKLNLRAQNPESIKNFYSRSKINISSFDVRGLDVDWGAFSILAKSNPNLDIGLIISDAYNEKNELSGTKYVIAINKSSRLLENDLNLSQLLAERLNQNEHLFGRGYSIDEADEYGGHPLLIASGQASGSLVEPSALEEALTNFFDRPRYNKEGFKNEITEIAKLVGSKNFTEPFLLPSIDKFHLPTWEVKININDQIISFNEDDLQVYKKCLKPNEVENNQKILTQKTNLSEAKEIAQYRLNQAKEDLKESISQTQENRLLVIIEELNDYSIRNLSIAEKIKVLSHISQSHTAIDQIWNPSNDRFKITSNVPEWIADQMSIYQNEKFNYTSVSSKIDRTLIGQLIQDLNQSQAERAQWDATLTIITKILTSEKYISLHQHQNFPDQLLNHWVEIVNQGVFSSQEKSKFLLNLREKTGKDLFNQWLNTIEPQARTYLITEIENFIKEEKSSTQNGNSLALHSQNRIIKPKRKEKLTPTIKSDQNILIQIGRDIKEKLFKQGIIINDNQKNSIPTLYQFENKTEADFAGGIVVEGSINIQAGEHKLIAAEITTQIVELYTQHPTAKIRLVCGSFPNALTLALTQKINSLDSLIQEKIVITWYDFQGEFFFDEPFLI